MKFDELNLVNQELKTVINVNDKEIEIQHYLPIASKINLIQLAIQQSSQEDGFINDILYETFFNLYVVFFYTNLEFTDEQKMNALETYDLLESNGLIATITAGIPKEEYDQLVYYGEAYRDALDKHRKSFVGIVNEVMKQLPAQMDKVNEIAQNFDPSKFQAVVDFATAANGGRNINTNQSVED